MAKIGHQPCRALRSGGLRPEQARCGSPPGLRLEVDIRECLPVAVTDDVAALVVLFDVPGRWEVAGFDHHRHLGRPAQLLQSRRIEELLFAGNSLAMRSASR